MSAKITYSIPNQGFEFVRDRIANILYEELANQVYMFNDEDLDVTVFIETNNPYADKTDLSFIQVGLVSGAYGNKHRGSVDGAYQYVIDVTCNSKATVTDSPDTLSAIKNQRITGAVRAILEDPLYDTLGFEKGFIKRVFFSNFDVMDQAKNDAMSTATNRMVFNVELVETTKFKEPKIIEGYDTQVKLGGTNKGYQFTGENYL